MKEHCHVELVPVTLGLRALRRQPSAVAGARPLKMNSVRCSVSGSENARPAEFTWTCSPNGSC